MRIPKICGSCGSDSVEVKNLKGRDFSWKDFSSIELLEDFKAPTCNKCSELFLPLGSGDRLDILILSSLRKRTSEYINDLLHNTSLNQKELADQLGISEVHLSKLKNMKDTAQISKPLFNLLKLLSVDSSRIGELAQSKPISYNRMNSPYVSRENIEVDYVYNREYGKIIIDQRSEVTSCYDEDDEVIAA
jgi:hypothetical protein